MLFQRLGLPTTRFFALLSDEELKLSEAERELNSLHVQFECATPAERPAIRKAALQKHAELCALAGPDDRLTQQIILRSKFLLGTEDGPYCLEDGLPLLLEAIRLTSPNFDPEHITLGLYSENEVKLINSIALCYLQAGKHHDAIGILRQLLTYLQTHTQRVPAARAHIPLVAFNYAREPCCVGRHDDAIKVANYGVEISVDYGYYLFLPDFIAVLAECYYYEDDLVKSIEHYRQAYYTYKAIRNEHGRETIQKGSKRASGPDLGINAISGLLLAHPAAHHRFPHQLPL